jgi:hypothetical protein
MANFASDSDLTNDSYNRGKVAINLLTATPDPNNNQTTITWNVVVSDGNSSYGGYNYNSPSGSGGRATGTITAATVVGDSSISGTSTYTSAYGSYDFGSGVISSPYFPRTSSTYTAIIAHDTTTGQANVTGKATFDGGTGPAGDASASTGSVALTDFSGPGTPAAPTVTRLSSSPATLNILSASTTSGSASITRYEYSISESSGGTGTPGTLSGTTAVSVTATTGYYVKTRAISWDGGEGSWGYGAWSPTTFVAGIPTAPGTPSISNVVANSLTLTWTAPSSNGGAAVSSYKVQATTNDGSTWTTIKTGVTGLTTNLTGLTIAATYKFRIIAVNSTGDSDAGTASVAQFISAYGYRYNGTAMTPITSAKIYVGVGGPGADANGYRAVQSVKKYTATGWQSLET